MLVIVSNFPKTKCEAICTTFHYTYLSTTITAKITGINKGEFCFKNKRGIPITSNTTASLDLRQEIPTPKKITATMLEPDPITYMSTRF